MKVFASAIALLFTSAAAASEIHEILTHSSVAEAVSVYHEAQDDAPCAAEATEFFVCLGDKFSGCFMELIKDLAEDTTCDDLKNSDFCPELTKCAAHIEADCTAKGEALLTCAATAYPDQEGCDLCMVEEEVIAVEVTSPTDAMSLPHVIKAVSVYHEAKDDADVEIPCVDETIEFFTCLGEEFTMCLFDIIEDLAEDTTCDDLKNSDFCPELTKCAVHVTVDCTAKEEALKTCAATAYPDAEDCDLCDTEKYVFGTFEVTSPTDAMSLPHVIKAVSVYHEAKDDADVEIPCVDETIEFFTCLGEEFTMCLFDIVEDLAEDTTCDDLKNSDFCPELTKCAVHVTVDCTAKEEALKTCAATAYPDVEDCDICETDVAIFSIA